jgi:SAM-dependent methyltransferase
MSQSDAWEAIAERWVGLVRCEGQEPAPDNWEPFLRLLPAPGRLTVDVGCGEGRIARQLRQLGHRVIAIDSSPTMIQLAREADPDGDYRVADASALPVDSGAADLVVAFMSLQDMDEHVAVTCEASRVLARGGVLCLALIHPFWSGGRFEPHDPEATFRSEDSYFEMIPHLRPVLKVPSVHRPLEAYMMALEEAGLLVEALRELAARRDPPGRLPTYLHIRAAKR